MHATLNSVSFLYGCISSTQFRTDAHINFIEIFGNYSNKKFLRDFPVIMPYLRHIVEQPIERFYCSLLVSLKARIRTIYVVDSFV